MLAVRWVQSWIWPEKIDVEKTIQDSKTQIEDIQKKESHIQSQIEKERSKAADFVRAGDKVSAIECLKRAKTHQHNIVELQKNRSNLENVLLRMEMDIMNNSTLDQFIAAEECIKVINKGRTADDVAEIMDNVRERMLDSKEVSKLIGQSLSVEDDINQDELDEELEGLVKHQEDELEGMIKNMTVNERIVEDDLTTLTAEMVPA
jgi:charged multivesicular body protein 4